MLCFEMSRKLYVKNYKCGKFRPYQISFLLSEREAKVEVGLPEVCCTLTSHKRVKSSLGDNHVFEDRSTSLRLMFFLPIPSPINFKPCGFIDIYDMCMCKSVGNSTSSNNDSKRKVFLFFKFLNSYNSTIYIIV